MRVTRFRAGLRLKLLAASSVLLLIPLFGLQYIRELERMLLDAQQQAVIGTARAVATALNDRPSVFRSGKVYSFPVSEDNDLRVANLDRPIVVDGLAEDWSRQPAIPLALQEVPATEDTAGFSARYRIGRFGNFVHVLVEVTDDRVILGDPEQAPPTGSDHLRIGVVTADEEFLQFIVTARGSGRVSVSLLSSDEDAVPDARIRGVWRLVPGGYVVEMQLPRSLIGPRFGLSVVDVDDPQTRALTAVVGTADVSSAQELGSVLVPSPEIKDIIRGLGRSRSRIWVLDVNRRVLAQAGSLHGASLYPEEPHAGALSAIWESVSVAFVRPLLRLVLGTPREDFRDSEPGAYQLQGPEIEAALAGRADARRRNTSDERAVVFSAAHPVWIDDRVTGAVVVEETTNDVLAVRNRAFEKLFAAILAVYLGGAAALLVFATRLSLRIRRLRDEAEQAIDSQGRVTGALAGSNAADEVGDLSRSFAQTLDRLRQYTLYLEQLGSRLSHELRTPVAVVRSSLDNLKQSALPEGAQVYVARAEEGLDRLNRIFSRMSEATRLEQTLASAERETFDLREVVRGCVEGYRLAHAGREIAFHFPASQLKMNGTPELIAQLLDKLVANAVEFSRSGAPIEVRLLESGTAAQLAVRNEGPPLPVEMEGRLFESMVSVRPGQQDAEPHLGLGLYIARLIAEFHGGRVSAHNRSDRSGVEVSVELPLLQAPDG